MFLLQTFSTLPLHTLYLDHHRPALYQFVTSTICHANAQHLSSNLFPLLVFGRLVEEEMGFTGLLLTFLICGAASNLASIFFMPSATLSLGASGAVFGLFTVAVAARVSMREAAWRSWVEVCVFGQYVWERLRSEVAVTAGGGIAGVNHVAHLGGAAAGLLMVMCLRILLGALEKGEEGGQGGKRAKVIK
jgi:membrane associated rhomboid family serine protease